MRVLHFFDGRRNNTRIIQIDFILMLQKYCDLFVYGPDEQENNGEKISPIRFDRNIDYADIVNEIKPDIVLLPEYSTASLMKNKLYQLKDIHHIPKVSIEVDYYEIYKDMEWHNKIGVDFIINRGPYDDSLYVLPHVWLPWSANNMFYIDETSDYLKDRINKVIFIGGGRYSRNKYYKIRQQAIRLLEKISFLDYYEAAPPTIYKNLISEYICGLSCSFEGLQMAPAKIFEIMASGTALLTTQFIYDDILFGNKQCFFKYEEDCSNLLDVVNLILSDFGLVKEVTNNALETINSRHLHKHRIKELYDILEALVLGKEVPKVWGI